MCGAAGPGCSYCCPGFFINQIVNMKQSERGFQSMNYAIVGVKRSCSIYVQSCTVFISSISRSITKFDYLLCFPELVVVATREGQRSYNTIVEYAFQLAQSPLFH